MSKSSIHGLHALPADYADLAALFGLAEHTLFRGVLAFPKTNAHAAQLRATTGNGSTDVPVAGGLSHHYSAVDLSSIFVKGTSGDMLTLVGESVERIAQGSME